MPTGTIETTYADGRDTWWLRTWWALAFIAVAVIPALVRFHRPPWALGVDEIVQFGSAYVAFLLVLVFAAARPHPRRALGVAIANVCAYGIVGSLVMLARPDIPFSRLGFGYGFLLSAALTVLPMLWAHHLRRLVPILAVGVAVSLALGVRLDLAAVEAENGDGSWPVTTALHRLTISRHPVTRGTAEANTQGGALAPFGSAVVLSTAHGQLHRVFWTPTGVLTSERMPFAVPLDFERYSRTEAFRTLGLTLRVTGLVASDTDGGLLYAAYDHWDDASSCFTTRVARIGLAVASTGSLSARGEWQQVYESKPCVTVTTGYDAVQTGGRLAMRPDGQLLLTLGDRGLNGLNQIQLAQSLDNDYGKVLVINPASGTASVLSVGHRNPQGLTVGHDGRVWETEHGPQGGDEINELVAGANYGWPLVSYGADYGHFVWPMSPSARDHGAFAEPSYVFVPSVGLSNLIEIRAPAPARWVGDLLVASMRGKALYRVRQREGHVRYAEPIPLDHRIRDLVQNRDGRIVLLTDDGFVLELAEAVTASVFDRCSGCHEPSGGRPAQGPPLRAIIGTPIAKHFEFQYSTALQAVGGVWTEERLDEFLKSPAKFAPGTTMAFPGITDPNERAALIEFLREYR